MQKKYILLVILILVIGGLFFSFSYRGDWQEQLESDSKQSDSPAEQPTERLNEVKLTLFAADEAVTWNLEAKELSRYDQETKLELAPVNIKALNETGQKIYSIAADQGIYHTGTAELNLRGPITINQDQFEIMISQLHWQKDNNLLTGSGGVVFKSPFFILRGDHFEASLKLNQLTVYGNQTKQAYFSWEERG